MFFIIALILSIPALSLFNWKELKNQSLKNQFKKGQIIDILDRKGKLIKRIIK